MWKILSLVFVFGLFHPFANADCDDCALYESASKQISLYKELALEIDCGVLPVGLSIEDVGFDDIFVSKKKNPDGYLINFHFKGRLEVDVCAFGTPVANIKGHGSLMITYQYYFATSEYVHIHDEYNAYGELDVELLGSKECPRAQQDCSFSSGRRMRSINLGFEVLFKHYIDAIRRIMDKIRPAIDNSVSYFNAVTGASPLSSRLQREQTILRSNLQNLPRADENSPSLANLPLANPSYDTCEPDDIPQCNYY